MKINSNFRTFAAMHFDATKYIASPSFGVNRFMLDRIGDETARATTIVQYQPNSKFPAHTHIGGEEFLVLEGTFKDQFGEFPAGTYVRNPIGSEHEPWVEEDGCTIMVKLLQMADTTGEGVETPLYVNLAKVRAESSTKVLYGQVAELYRNDRTGEVVEMFWLDADHPFTIDSKAVEGGEELFIIRGSIKLCDEEFGPWDWLRFPVGSTTERLTLVVGPSGAQVYRKTGHLTDLAMSMEKIRIGNDESVISD